MGEVQKVVCVCVCMYVSGQMGDDDAIKMYMWRWEDVACCWNRGWGRVTVDAGPAQASRSFCRRVPCLIQASVPRQVGRPSDATGSTYLD